MTIVIDGTIGKDYWGDDETIISASKVRNQLKEATGDITVEINSPGGSVMEGITIFNLLRDYDKGKVNVVITGMCASIATYISLAGDSVEVHDNSVYMIHNVSSFVVGDHHEMRKVADTVEGLTLLIAQKYVQKSKKSKSEILELLNQESWYYGKEIVQNGFADTLIESQDASNRAELVALAKETFSSAMEIVQNKTQSDEQQEAVAFLEQHKPKNRAIDMLNLKIKNYKRRLKL